MELNRTQLFRLKHSKIGFARDEKSLKKYPKANKGREINILAPVHSLNELIQSDKLYVSTGKAVSVKRKTARTQT